MAAPAVDAAAVAQSSRRLILISAGLGLTFAVVVGGLWLTSVPTPARARGDLFASRRTPPPVSAEAVKPVTEPPSFLEPSGAGAIAYAGGDLASSLAQFQQAVEKNPDDAESWSNLGQVLVKMGRTVEALPAFSRAVALMPGRWTYRFNQARAFGLLGRLDASAGAYREAQQLFPEDYVTAFNLALTLHKKGDEAAAVEQYKKAIALSPDDPSFHLALGISYERLQKPVDAAAAYTEALRLAPSAPDADTVRARIARLTAQPGQPAAAPAPSGSGL